MPGKKTMAALLGIILLGLAFSSTGIPQQNAGVVPGEDPGFYYTIQKKDTLWGLSEKFYDSQWDWPGLWQMNPDIKNPHWIYPGRKIQVFLKDDSGMPARVASPWIDPKKNTADTATPFFSFPGMDHAGFIRETAHPSLGSIIKEQDDHLMMSINDIIYICPSKQGSLIPGRTYQIFTTTRVAKKIHQGVFKGVKHLIKARVTILEQKQTYVTGVITHAYRPVNKGDLIMEDHQRAPILTVENRPEPIDARLICSEDNHLMINDYVIAFMDAGSTRVKPGQIYSIFRKNPAKDHPSFSLENLESGKLIVLSTEKTASTVMILSSKHAIYPDDIIN